MTETFPAGRSSLSEFYGSHYSINLPITTDRAVLINKLLHERGSFARSLDIGCGDGSLTLEYAKNCKETLGFEVAFRACQEGRRRGLPMVRGSAQAIHLPFKDGSFDLVIAGEIIEHLLDPDNLLDELWRLLREGGHAVITTPNLASWYNRILILAGFQPYHTDVSLRHQVGKLRNVVGTGSGHLMVFTLRSFRELLLLHGFELVEVRGCGVDIPIPYPLRVLERAVSRFPGLASLLVAVVRKPSEAMSMGRTM